MELGLLITGSIAFLGLWGSLWYKIGSLTTEVRQHNRMLAEIQKTLERILMGGKT